ncbi:hypothetical protein Q3G72_012161 [Acer saccharum]|nr:hypothetical protein Q3G72_012161 [Acer saccharum]
MPPPSLPLFSVLSSSSGANAIGPPPSLLWGGGLLAIAGFWFGFCFSGDAMFLFWFSSALLWSSFVFWVFSVRLSLLSFSLGLDGLGLGLILHHKPLGKAFEVMCLHIPVHDRTSFEGDSFGGCLAVAVAARNLSIDISQSG